MKKFTQNNNGVTTQILVDYSPANQAWLVWRRDGVYDTIPRVFSEREDALLFWEREVDYLQEVTALGI